MERKKRIEVSLCRKIERTKGCREEKWPSTSCSQKEEKKRVKRKWSRKRMVAVKERRRGE